MIKLYTIGFTKKNAQQFFELLTSNEVQVANIEYSHELDFAPTKELLSQYRKKKLSWEDYEVAYLNLLDMRKVGKKINIEQLHQNCLLCSEHTAEKCHRRLLAEYLQAINKEVEIIHLT